MARFSMTPTLASNIAQRYGFSLSRDFHALDSEQVTGILAAAKAWKYRQPRNANGSKARYFHGYLQRAYNREGA